MKKIQVLLVQITAAIFVLYGLGFTFAPLAMAQFVTDASPTHASAIIDMRATYGGMSLAVGVLLFVLSARAEWLKAGLLAVTIIMAGMALGRVVGIVVDGNANTFMYIYLGLEIVGAVAAGMLLRIGTDN